MNKIRVIVKKPGEPAEVREIENSLEAFQAIVGGRLEAVYLGDSLHMYIDDEGKLKGSEPNILLMMRYGRIDMICGPLIIFRADVEGNEIDLSLSDTVRMQNFCNRNAVEHFC